MTASHSSLIIKQFSYLININPEDDFVNAAFAKFFSTLGVIMPIMLIRSGYLTRHLSPQKKLHFYFNFRISSFYNGVHTIQIGLQEQSGNRYEESAAVEAGIIPASCSSGGGMHPDWDAFFMKISYAVSERSTCDRALLGCVLILDKCIPKWHLPYLRHSNQPHACACSYNPDVPEIIRRRLHHKTSGK